MRIAKYLLVAAGFVLTVNLGQAAHVWEDSTTWWDSHLSYDQNSPRFTANELSLDLFGSYHNPEGKLADLFSTNIRHGNWGGGGGINYFFTREFGLGADVNLSDKTGDENIVDYVVGDLLLRLPMGNSGLAPYLVGSGGRGMSPVYQWVYGGGVGLEYRFNPVTGIFSDARFLWSDRGTDFDALTIRAGMRFAF